MTAVGHASEVPDLDDGLWARLARATTELYDAETSVWNGLVHYVPGDFEADVTGVARNDGAVELNRLVVVAPLYRMYAEGPGSLRDPLFAARCWRALRTAVHEFGHLTAPPHWTLADRTRDLLRPSLEPIEEAFNEAHAYAITPDAIDRALHPAFASALHRVHEEHPHLTPRGYPGWTTAAVTFAAEIVAETGVPGAEVLRTAAREPDSRKAPALADLLFRHSALPRLVPAPDQLAVKGRIASAIHTGFETVADLSWNDESPDPAIRGTEIARTTLDLVRETEQSHAESGVTGAHADLDHLARRRWSVVPASRSGKRIAGR